MTRLKPLLFALGLFSTAALAAPLKIGTTAAFAPPLEVAVQEAKAAGVDVEIVEFSDWIAPNTSLANHDIDANYYQHIPFLENAKRTAGYDLVAVAPGIINNVGLYSKKYRTLAEVPKGARVAIANDAINGGRGLLLLEKAGFITLKPGVGYHATLADITGNPRDIQIVELEAVQLARSLDDVDVAQGYPHYLRLAKTIDPNQALLFDGLDHPEYVIQFVARPDNKDDPRLAKLIDLYQHSPKVRAALDQAHGTLDHPEYVIQFVARPDNKDDPRLAKLIDLYQHSPKVRAALDQAHGTLYQPGWKE